MGQDDCILGGESMALKSRLFISVAAGILNTQLPLATPQAIH